MFRPLPPPGEGDRRPGKGLVLRPMPLRFRSRFRCYLQPHLQTVVAEIPSLALTRPSTTHLRRRERVFTYLFRPLL